MRIARAQVLWLAVLAAAGGRLAAQAQPEPGRTGDAHEQAQAAKEEGDKLFKTGNYAAAAEAYGRAIQLDPKLVAAYKERATAYLRLHQAERAQQDCDAAIQLDPEDPELYLTRGGAHRALNQLEAAIRDFDTAIEKKPDYGRAYSARVGAKSQAGDKQGAQADWDKADSLGFGVRRIRVGGNVQSAKLIRQTQPVYPKEAKKAGLTGVVRMDAIIGKDGTIQNLTLVSGDPLLAPAAMDAVRQWVYQPTLLDGRPVEILTEIDVTFALTRQ